MDLQPFIYVLRLVPTYHHEENWTEEARNIVGTHFRYLQDYQKQGVLIMAGRTSPVDETTFGIVVFQAATEEAALEIMRNDPAVVGGVMTAELFPFHVALLGS